jgi:endonuclease VIII-like 1
LPEIDSLRITADLINDWSKNEKYQWIRQDTTSKNKLILKDPIDQPFKIIAKSRGKEFKLVLVNDQIKTLMFTFGMTGYWLSGDINNPPKHTKVAIININKKQALYFIDVRRFGKWRWGDWAENRGPDPIDEFDDFKNNIINNLHDKTFNKPICEMLMNQKYFNGIGNYLRAMIVDMVDCNPFMSASNAIKKYPEILDYSRNISIQAYMFNANKLKVEHGFKNPYPDRPINLFTQWKYSTYRNPKFALVIDKGNRVMWYDPKWKEEALKMYPEEKRHQAPKGYLKK